jgi:hypothetical protein
MNLWLTETKIESESHHIYKVILLILIKIMMRVNRTILDLNRFCPKTDMLTYHYKI